MIVMFASRNRVLLIQVIILPVVIGLFFMWMFFSQSLLFSRSHDETNMTIEMWLLIAQEAQTLVMFINIANEGASEPITAEHLLLGEGVSTAIFAVGELEIEASIMFQDEALAASVLSVIGFDDYGKAYIDSDKLISLGIQDIIGGRLPHMITIGTRTPHFYESDEYDLEYEAHVATHEESEPTVYIGSLIQFAGINWRILDIVGSQALLISENIITRRAFHHTFENVSWETSEIREYLNGDFVNRKSREEQARIRIVSDDKVFLLGVDEVLRFFGDSGRIEDGALAMLSDGYNEARIALSLHGEPSWWWLRDSGEMPTLAAFVDEYGQIYLLGFVVSWSGGGVRPSLWLELDS